MNVRLSESQLSKLNDFITARMGLYFAPNRLENLYRNISLAAKEFGFQDPDVFIDWLLSSPLDKKQVEMLASFITIGETYFWREPQVFEVLCDKILPELIQKRKSGNKRLRIWSAGCSTGEEPYSIAILLRGLIPDLEEWHITLLATDINPRILQKAKIGEYGKWSFRNVPKGFKEKYFQPADDGKLKILPEIRKMVTFAYLNLAEDIYPSSMNNTKAMDLIFCRNVLMYFLPERAQEVGQKFFNTLVEGGWLMVSASELSQQLFPQFSSTRFPEAIVYRRESEKARVKAVIAQPQPAVRKLPVKPPLKTVPKVNQKLSSINKQRESNQVVDIGDKTENKTPLVDAVTIVRALANQGKLSEAIAACEDAIAADKLNPHLHYLYAIIFQEQDRNADAIQALKQSLYLDPNFILAYFMLGSLAQRQGNTQYANKNLRNALALLDKLDSQEIVPEAEGLTAGRLSEIISATFQIGAQI